MEAGEPWGRLVGVDGILRRKVYEKNGGGEAHGYENQGEAVKTEVWSG